jgi:hypothetical protein
MLGELGHEPRISDSVGAPRRSSETVLPPDDGPLAHTKNFGDVGLRKARGLADETAGIRCWQARRTATSLSLLSSTSVSMTPTMT